MNKDKLNYKLKVILLLCGFIVFSPISSFISLNILKLPLAVPEAFFFPFYLYLKKHIDFNINKRYLYVVIYAIISLLIIGMLVDNFRLSSMISVARGYLYMGLAFSIFINKRIQNIEFLMYLSLGSTIAWVVNSLIFFNSLYNYTVEEDRSLAVYGNLMTLMFAVSIPIIYKKNKITYIIIITGIILSFTSGLRRQIIIFLATYISSIFLSIKLQATSFIKITIIALASILLIIPFYHFFYEISYDISPVFHYRVFGKSEQFITGELSESDVIRRNSTIQFINNIEDYILPRGFVSKRTMEDEGTGIYMDSPFIELFYTFGILICVITGISLIIRLRFHIKNYYLRGNKESGVCIISIITILLLSMIEGSFLNYPTVTPITGYALARIFSTKNLIQN